MLAPPEVLNGQTMTADSYLAMEREGIRELQGKYELFNQKIRFMAGASQAHNTIAGNILTLLKMFIWQQNLSYYVNQSDMKVISFLNYKNYFYPDIVFAEDELNRYIGKLLFNYLKFAKNIELWMLLHFQRNS